MMKPAVITITVIIAVFTLAGVALPEEPDCLTCHEELKAGAFVHNALVSVGCTACHPGIDAKDIPHKLLANIPKGLPGETADLCYSCHDKTKFYAPTIHAPVGIGLCTSCHNPHSSGVANLLVAEPDKLCFNCHEKEKFSSKKSVHGPVAAGKCLSCHVPHASDNEGLVVRKGNILCRRCHPRTEREPHAVTGLRTAGHPVRGKEDPKRKGKTFECLSCHQAHASEWVRLYRYKANSWEELCIYCHTDIY